MGKEFIVGFMENIFPESLELFVTTPNDKVVHVDISSPKHPSTALPRSVSVRKGKVERIDVDISFMMVGTSRDSKAILITADEEIVVYGANIYVASTDAFLALPTDVLGKEYFTISYLGSTILYGTQVLLIGISESTNVAIKLSETLGSSTVDIDGVHYSAGHTFHFTLNRYETYQYTSASGDLTGSHIISNKPVAVFSGNKCTRIGPGACDHLVEMLMPVDTWGKRFATVPIPERTSGDIFRFVSSEPHTTVSIQGGLSETFIITNPGEMVERTIASDAYCLIEADKAIMTVQFVKGQSSTDLNDPSMMIVQPFGGYSNGFTFATLSRSTGDFINYFTFVVRDEHRNGLLIDGSPLSTVFHPIPGSDFVGGYITVTPGVHTVYHQSPIALFAGYLYGRQLYVSYAFPIGTRLAPINTVSRLNLRDVFISNNCITCHSLARITLAPRTTSLSTLFRKNLEQHYKLTQKNFSLMNSI